MLTVAQHGYSEAEVYEALRGIRGSRRWTFRYELLDSANERITDLTNVMSGSVDYDANADIKRTAKFTVTDTGDINFLNNRIKPYARLAMPSVVRSYDSALGSVPNMLARYAMDDKTGPTNVQPLSLQNLTDRFTGTAVDYTKWSAGDNNATVVNRKMSIPSASSYVSIVSPGWNALGSYFYAQVFPYNGSSHEFAMEVRGSDPDTMKAVLILINGNIEARIYDTSATPTAQVIAPYNANLHAWWRIRESGGVFFFSTSTNGYDWTEHVSYTYGWTATSVTAGFRVGHWSTSDANQAALVDNVNTPFVPGGNPGVVQDISGNGRHGFIGSIDDMDTGWTANFSSGTEAHDLTIGYAGNGCVKLIPANTGNPSGMRKTVTADYSGDEAGFRIAIRSTNWAQATGVRLVMVTTAGTDYFYYGMSSVNFTKANNTWYEVVLTKDNFSVVGTPDWANITRWLVQASGVGGATPIVYFDELTVSTSSVERAQQGLLSEGSSFHFDTTAAGAFSRLNASWLAGHDAITVISWIKADSIGHNRGWIVGRNPGITTLPSAINMTFDATGNIGGATNVIRTEVYLRNSAESVSNGTGYVAVESPANTQSTDLMQVIMTWQSGKTMKMYINGVLQTPSGESGQGSVGITDGGGSFHIGKSRGNSANGWCGYVDDVSIFSAYIDDDTAELLYKTGLQTGRFGTENYVEWPQGVFVLSSPTRQTTDSGQVVRDVDAYDQLVVFRDDLVDERTVAAAGDAYTTVVGTLLGSVNKSITPSSKTIPVTMEWDVGTSKLQIINDLIAAINYEALFFDEEGTAIVRPYKSPTEKPSTYTYATDEVSVITPGASQTLDLYSVANKWVLVVSDPERMLSSSYTNSNPSSPTSTVSRGRTIVDFRTEQDAADQDSLDAKVLRLAFEASQVYEAIDFSTAIMPIHGHSDVYDVVHDDLALSAKYNERKWSLPLKEGATMTHTARRMVQI